MIFTSLNLSLFHLSSSYKHTYEKQYEKRGVSPSLSIGGLQNRESRSPRQASHLPFLISPFSPPSNVPLLFFFCFHSRPQV